MSEEVCAEHRIRTQRPECHMCDGEGLREEDDDLTFRPTFVTCYACNGTGISPFHVCDICEDEARDDEGPPFNNQGEV